MYPLNVPYTLIRDTIGAYSFVRQRVRLSPEPMLAKTTETTANVICAYGENTAKYGNRGVNMVERR
eukprot:8208668-Pyramimonas_sp.AAC.1